jgi:hypothetical protein
MISPSFVDELEKIHGLPEYYLGYYLREMEGGLGRHVSVPAKENHPSVVAYIGEGGLWCIAEQIKYLLDGQKDQVRRKSTEEQNHHIAIGAHHTKCNGLEGRVDITARKLLSEYAYKNFVLVSLKRSSGLQHKWICCCLASKYNGSTSLQRGEALGHIVHLTNATLL